MTEARAWQVALEKVRVVEAAWDDPTARQREILACRSWMEEQKNVPHLCRLAPLMDVAMDGRQLWSVLVPVERANARLRVTDVEILSADAALSSASSISPMPLTVVVDCMRSAFNLGGVFRTAECVGAARVWLCGYTAEPTQAPVAQAAMGTEKLVPWQTWPRVTDALAALHAEGVSCVALETVRDAPAPENYAWKFPCALVLGNERFGLDSETLRQVDGVVRIPLYGRKNSLNVVTAFAIAAFASRRAWNAG